MAGALAELSRKVLAEDFRRIRPETKFAGLEALNRAIATGGVRRNDDGVQADALREALVTRDRKTVYRIDDGIPVLLVEDGIATAQLEGFPRQ